MSRVLKKLILIIFASVLVPFNGGEDFQRSFTWWFLLTSLFPVFKGIMFAMHVAGFYLFVWCSQMNLEFCYFV